MITVKNASYKSNCKIKVSLKYIKTDVSTLICRNFKFNNYLTVMSSIYIPHLQLFIYVTVSEQKPDMFALKLKFILLPQLIATLNNYACLLPPLANVDWSAFPECFLPTM